MNVMKVNKLPTNWFIYIMKFSKVFWNMVKKQIEEREEESREVVFSNA